jgi:phospholipid/cholesterol/gamma-HCH transport system substrate-binding protein
MKKKRDEVLVGILILATVIVGVVGSIWLARGGLEKGYPLYAQFKWGAGLKQGQPVWLSGVSIGYISNIDLLPEGTLVTELRITDDMPVPRNSLATVVPNGLFGDMAVAVTPAGPSQAKYVAGDTIPAGKPAAGLQELTGRADSIARGVNAITGEIEKQLVTGGGIADLRHSVTQVNRLLVQLAGVISEQSRQLSGTMGSVRAKVDAIDVTQVDTTLQNLKMASGNMVVATNQMTLATQRLTSLVARIDSGGGTVGKLLNDPGLYDDLRKTNSRMVMTIDSLTALITDIKKNPRRYINVRIF